MSSDEESISGEEATSDEEEVEQPVVIKKKRKAKKKKDPNKPKRNMSAFFLYSNANRERVKTENPEAKFGDIAKILSQEFKGLPENEKEQWKDLAAKDKERYQREMEDYVPPSDDSEDDGKRKKKKKKDPNAPKRNQTAFFLYSNMHRANVKETNPDAGFGDIAKIISKQFKALTEKEREKYDKLAAEDKERYQRQMAAYKGGSA